MIEKGKEITPTDLTNMFNDTIKKMNGLTSSEFVSLSSGQIFTSGNLGRGEEYTSTELLDIQTEQYFDNIVSPSIRDAVTGNYIFNSRNYLQKLIEDVTMIQEL